MYNSHIDAYIDACIIFSISLSSLPAFLPRFTFFLSH